MQAVERDLPFYAMSVDMRLKVLKCVICLFATMKSAAPRLCQHDPASKFSKVFLHCEKAQILRASSQPWLILWPHTKPTMCSTKWRKFKFRPWYGLRPSRCAAERYQGRLHFSGSALIFTVSQVLDQANEKVPNYTAFAICVGRKCLRRVQLTLS